MSTDPALLQLQRDILSLHRRAEELRRHLESPPGKATIRMLPRLRGGLLAHMDVISYAALAAADAMSEETGTTVESLTPPEETDELPTERLPRGRR